MSERLEAPPDERERARFLRELGRNAVVEAGAGTGKTTLLVDRIVALVEGAGVEPDGRPKPAVAMDRVAAITFTELAAAELAARVRDALEERLAGAEVEERRERLAEALDALPRARFGTIHAFCARILREMPLEAGVEPGFAVLTQHQQRLLVAEVFEAWFAEASRAPEVRRALALGATLDRLREVARGLAALEERANAWPGPDDDLRAPGGALAGFVGFLRARAVAFLDEVGPPRGEHARYPDKMRRALDLAREISERFGGLLEVELGARERELLCAELEDELFQTVWETGAGLGKASAPAWRALHGEESAPAAKELVDELFERARALRAAVGHDAIARATGVLRGFGAVYAREKERRGALDFDDLLLRARDLVRGDARARGRLAAAIDCLFVDEFQDTDPVQAEVVFLLAGDGGDDWRAVAPTPGRLVLVGDPKQSIYRFRRADVETYRACCRRVVDADRAAAYSIQANFRSDAPIVAWVNRQFGGEGPGRMAEPPGGLAYQADYVELLPVRAGEAAERALGGRGVTLVAAPEELRATLASTDDARRVEAACVLEMLERDVIGRWRTGSGEGEREVGWGDVAVLAPTHTALAPYVEACARADVAFVVEGGRDFFETQEVGDALAVLAAVARPDDPVAVAGALRTPWLGVSDEALLDHVAGGRRLDEPPAGEGELARAHERLAGWIAEREARPAADVVEGILSADAIAALYRAKPGGAQRVLNLRKLEATAREIAGGRALGFAALERRLGELARAGDEASASATAAGVDALRLLTIHKSKGLEFPVVVLGGLATETKAPPLGPWVARDGGVVWGGARPLWARGGEEAFADEGVRAEAECLRLLYVAATRAASHLVLPLVPKGVARGKPVEPAKAFGGALLGRFLDAATIAACAGERPAGCELVVARQPRLEPVFSPLEEPPPGEAGALAAEHAEAERARAALVERVVARRRLRPSDAEEPVRAVGPASDRRRARARGTLVHRALELGWDDARIALEARIERLEGEDAELAARMVATARELGRAAGEPVAVALWREYPLLWFEGDAEVQGSIDLVRARADGSFDVVDYKTGPADRDGDEAHRAQLERYLGGLARVTAAPARATVALLAEGREVAI